VADLQREAGNRALSALIEEHRSAARGPSGAPAASVPRGRARRRPIQGSAGEFEGEGLGVTASVERVASMRSEPPVPVQRFESREHRTMGDTGSGGARITLPGGLDVSFGEITALAGDFFGSVAQIQALAGKDGDGSSKAGTRDEIEYALNVKVRKTKSDKDFGSAVRDAVNSRYYALAGTNLTHFTEPRAGDAARSHDELAGARRTVPAGAEGAYGVPKGASIPVTNAGSYRENHLMAIRTAALAGAKGTPLDESLLYEAFGSHFLTDAYSAGHLRTPRAAIGDWWNPKIPMFWTNLQLWMAEVIAKHMNEHSIAGYPLTVQVLYESAQSTLAKVAAKMPALTFGDLISGALHDFDNQKGVDAQVGGAAVKLVGDGEVLDPKGRALAAGVETAEKAAAGVKASLKDVHEAYEMGKAGKDPEAVIASLRLPDGLFRAEQLWPRALPDSDAQQSNARLPWRVATPDQLFADARMREALATFAREKADDLGSSIELEPPLKADKEAALKGAVLDRLRAGEAEVVKILRAVIAYTPGSATGATGGVFGHDKDDDALSYYKKAKTAGALDTLTLDQRKRLVRLVLEGATIGDEETMVADILTSNLSHAPAVIDSVGWRWIWDDLGGKALQRVVDTVGPVYWARRSLDAKKAEVKYHSGGVTTDVAQRLIIVILRTCAGPKEVRAIDSAVGWPGLDWDLTGVYQDEFDRLKR
jgi:hypothetical protein